MAKYTDNMRPLDSQAQKWYDQIVELLEKACDDIGWTGEAMALCYKVEEHAANEAERIVQALES